MADRLKGFSLIELLVVTAVVLIIAAITIPEDVSAIVEGW
jgi:prepilin-type N-terminal cleavage/methylation domain-containing protein